MGDGLPSVEETQDASSQRGGAASEEGDPRAADGLRGRGIGVGAIDAERLRSAVASRLFGVEAEPVKIGRFTVLKRLGAGGMGVVYSAYDDQLDRKLAIKLLKGEVNEQRKARLMREAQALARVSHPNVIHVYEVDTFRGQIYLAMEFVRGRPLDQIDRTPDGDASLEAMMDWFRQAGEGLAAAHQAGLVHRDFKPENCLVGDDGRVRVLDFGLARASGDELDEDLDPDERAQLSASSSDHQDAPLRTARLSASSGSMADPLTRTGAIMGTPAYMAPEQHMGAAVDERSDQFSFCVSLWEKLYGERPFAGNTIPSLALAVTRGKVAEPPSGRGVPGWIHRVLLRGLSVDPADRWPDMQTLLAQLSPERRNRRKLGLGVGLVASLAVASFAWSATREEAGPCDNAAAEMAGVWDAKVRAKVKSAFLDTKEAYAEEVFAGTAQTLDGYAKRWGELNQQACLARKVDKTDDPEMYGRKTMCLSQRLARVEQLVVELKEIDAKGLERVRRAADELPVLEDCVDAEALARTQAPMDAATRAKVDAVERVLARVETKLELGRYKDALSMAEEAKGQAEEARDARVEARALMLLGRAHAELKQNEEAETHLREALRRADVARDDTTRVRAWLHLLRLVGVAKRDFGQVDDLAADAKAALERLGDAPLLWAEYYSNLGSIDKARGDFDRAVEYHSKALEIRLAELGEHTVPVAMSRNNLATALSAKGDFVEAEKIMRETLALFTEVLGEWHPYTEIVAQNLGTAVAQRGVRAAGPESEAAFVEAEKLFKQAIAVNERRLGPDHPGGAKRIHNLAEFFLKRGRYDDARREFERALRLKRVALAADHVDVASSQLGLGASLLELGELDEAQKLLDEALATYQREENASDLRGRATCLFALARLHHKAGRSDEASELGAQAKELFEQSGKAGEIDLAEVTTWLQGLTAASP